MKACFTALIKVHWRQNTNGHCLQKHLVEAVSCYAMFLHICRNISQTINSQSISSCRCVIVLAVYLLIKHYMDNTTAQLKMDNGIANVNI